MTSSVVVCQAPVSSVGGAAGDVQAAPVMAACSHHILMSSRSISSSQVHCTGMHHCHHASPQAVISAVIKRALDSGRNSTTSADSNFGLTSLMSPVVDHPRITRSSLYHRGRVSLAASVHSCYCEVIIIILLMIIIITVVICSEDITIRSVHLFIREHRHG